MLRSILALALSILSAGSAAAGVVMEFKNSEAGSSEPAAISKAFIGTDRVRIEAEGHVVIYRGDKDVAWVVQPEDKSYMEMTRAGASAMADAMKQMQAELAGLPPEQRAMVEAMMKQHGGGAMPGAAPKPSPMKWTSNGTSDTIGGHACKGYDGARDGRLVETICAADWANFGVTADDFAVFKEMAEFFAEMAGPMGQQMQSHVPDADVPGVVVRAVTKSSGGDQVFELIRFEKTSVSADLFEVPTGFRKESIESMGDAGEDAPAPRRRHGG